jgi:hypothetical protein
MLKRRIGRLMFLLVLVLASARAPAQNERHTLMGLIDVWVIDGATRMPASGVQVWEGVASVNPVEWVDIRTTNTTGRLLIGPRPQNVYFVTAHARKRQGWHSAGEQVVVERGRVARVSLVPGLGAAPSEPRWSVPPRGVLDVIAIDSGTGQGLDGATVRVLDYATMLVSSRVTAAKGPPHLRSGRGSRVVLMIRRWRICGPSLGRRGSGRWSPWPCGCGPGPSTSSSGSGTSWVRAGSCAACSAPTPSPRSSCTGLPARARRRWPR